MRFADKTSHQIFVEPEGLTTHEVYPNGISTSLPYDIQEALVRSIAGFEQAHLTRPGYAIEYDFFDPRDLKPSLETRYVQGLFFAGQINGTTGYEEAAAQGLLAGANAALQVQGREPWSPRRDEAYSASWSTTSSPAAPAEPYRMFTSRAEYRLMLREDNADLRLTEIGRGSVWSATSSGAGSRPSARRSSANASVCARPGSGPRPSIRRSRSQVLGEPLRREARALELLARPNVGYAGIRALTGDPPEPVSSEVAEQLEIQARYHGYISRQRDEIERQREQEIKALPEDFDFDQVRGLVRRGAREIQSGSARHHRSGRAHPRRHPGGGLAAADPSQASVRPAMKAPHRTEPSAAERQLIGQRFDQGATELGLSLTAEQRQRLLQFLDLLVRWNQAYNLTAVRDPVEMVAKHLLDSLAIHPFLFGETLLDIGTGAGLPGLPLAILSPERRFWLLDSNGKKIRFVRQALLELGLDNVEPVQARIETYRPAGEIQYHSKSCRRGRRSS